MKKQFIKNTKGYFVDTMKYFEEANIIFLRITDSIYFLEKQFEEKPFEQFYHDYRLVLMCLNDYTMKVAIFEQNMVDLVHANFDVEGEE